MLLPLAGLFAGVVRLRRLAYSRGWKSSFAVAAPVWVVGNITAGGSGKTPMVIWLVNWLVEQGLRPGVISRPTYLWSRYLESALTGAKAGFVVVHTGSEGVDDGYAHYTLAWSEDPIAESYGTGKVHDLWGTTPAVETVM